VPKACLIAGGTSVSDGHAARFRAQTATHRRHIQENEFRKMNRSFKKRNLIMSTALKLNCPSCGNQEVRILHQFTLKRGFESTLPCICDHAKDGIAAVHLSTVLEDWLEDGYLDEDGQFEIYDKDRIEQESDKDLDELDIRCHACHQDATECEWNEEEPDDPRTVDARESWTGRCRRCNSQFVIDWPATESAYA